MPHSHPTSREALHPLLSLEGPRGLSAWPNCVSASRHLPSRRSPGSESRGLPYLWTSTAGRSLRCKPHCGSLLRVTSHLRKATPHTAAPRSPFPVALHGRPDSPGVTGQPSVRTPGIPPPLGRVNLRRDDSPFHPQAFHGSRPPRLKHSCSPSQAGLSLEPKPCTKRAPPGEDPPHPGAPTRPGSLSAPGLPARRTPCCTFCVCLLGALSTHPDPGPDSTWRRPSGHRPAWPKGCPRGRGCPKRLSSTPVSPHPRPC